MLSTALCRYVRRNRFILISSVGDHSTNEYIQLLLMLNGIGDKSFVDDLVASRYCKCESSLCCYEALRFILCFYDLFFPVSKFQRLLNDEKFLPLGSSTLNSEPWKISQD